MELHDISVQLSERLAPWPGDTSFRFALNLKISEGATVNVGAVSNRVGISIPAAEALVERDVEHGLAADPCPRGSPPKSFDYSTLLWRSRKFTRYYLRLAGERTGGSNFLSLLRMESKLSLLWSFEE